MKDTLLFGVELEADLGKIFNVSKDLVFPYPDNLLLNEKNYPILQERNEWIFLDNEHPVSAKPIGEEYWEDIDELFDALCIKIYKKTGKGGDFDARLTVDKSTINEGEVAVVRLNTVGFTAGTEIYYQITNIGPDNVNVPLIGTVTLNSTGVGTLAIRLMEGSPRTDFDSMVVEMMIMGGKKISIGYNLVANEVQTTETTVHQYANGPLLEGPVVRGDIYSLKVLHRSMNGKVLKLQASALTATDRIIINETEYAGNAVVNLNVPSTGKQMAISFTVKSRTNTTAGSLGLKLTTPNGTVEDVALDVEPFTYTALEFYNPETGDILTEIGYAQPFRIRVKQNSKDNGVVDLQFKGNTTTGVLNPTYIPPLYCNRQGIGETGTYMLLPVNGVEPTAGELSFTALDPVTQSINIKAFLQVTI